MMKYLMGLLYLATAIIFIWFLASYVDVLMNNSLPGGVLQPWNFFLGMF